MEEVEHPGRVLVTGRAESFVNVPEADDAMFGRVQAQRLRFLLQFLERTIQVEARAEGRELA